MVWHMGIFLLRICIFLSSQVCNYFHSELMSSRRIASELRKQKIKSDIVKGG